MSSFNLSSIRQRLTASLMVGAVALSVLISVAVWSVLKSELNELMDHGLQESAELIHNVLANAPVETRRSHSTRVDTEYAEHLIWQLVDLSSGTVVSQSMNAPATPLTTNRNDAVQRSGDGAWHLVTLQFKHDQLLLVVAQSEDERHEALTETLGYTGLATLLVFSLGILVMHWRTRVELQPLQRLSEGVMHYDPLQPASAPVSTGRSELQPIERAIYDLGQRLGQRIISEQAFTAHAAHALRTPVAGIDAQLSLAIREAPETLRPRLLRAREAVTRLGRVMQALVSMFRSGLEPQRASLPLGQLIETLPLHKLQLRFDPLASVDIDPDLLAAVLFNVLDNAQRHGARTVELSVTRTDDQTRLVVQDDGEGCPAERLARLRDGLARRDYGPHGGFNGLGLILADLVMRAHGGQLQLLESDRGFGLALVWPTPAPAPDKGA